MEKHFRNELGNQITASITSGPVLKSPSGAAVRQLNLTLAGPKSTSENIITVGEARVLWQMLSAVFHPQAR